MPDAPRVEQRPCRNRAETWLSNWYPEEWDDQRAKALAAEFAAVEREASEQRSLSFRRIVEQRNRYEMEVKAWREFENLLGWDPGGNKYLDSARSIRAENEQYERKDK